MPQYSFKVVDDEGSTRKGEIYAPSRKDAILALRKQGVHLLHLEEVSSSGDFFSAGSIFNFVPLADLLFFTKHLSVLLKSGLSIINALKLLEAPSMGKAMRKIVADIVDEIQRGSTFTECLALRYRVFSRFYVGMVYIGEESGTLARSLSYIEERLKKQMTLRSKVRSALMYPFIIFVALVGIAALIIGFILPRITKIFESFRVELPLSTRVFLSIAHFFQHFWFVGLILILVFIFAFVMLSRVPKVRYYLHVFYLKIPILGNIFRNVQIVTFTRTLQVLLLSGMSISDSLEIVAQVLTNDVYVKATRSILQTVQSGGDLSSGVKSHKRLFPSVVSQMVFVGESSGKLSELLGYAAEFYEEMVDDTTKNLSSIVEPILLIIMGIVVGGSALAVLMPVYSLPDLINR